MNNTNWLTYMNDMDKTFYNRIADVTLSALYETENMVNDRMVEFQQRMIKRSQSQNQDEQSLIKILDDVCNPIIDKHQLNTDKLCKLYDGYIDEMQAINMMVNHNPIAKRRILITEKKYKDILFKSIAMSRNLKNSFIKGLPIFVDDFFEIEEDSKKELKCIEFEEEIMEQVKIQYNKIFKQRDIVKYLEKNGYEYKNTGRHANYTDGINTIPIPTHGSKDLGYGLQRKIQKEVKIKEQNKNKQGGK